MDPRSQLVRNARAIAASRLIAAVTSVLAVPVVIHYVGLAQFGLWESMVALVSLSTVLTSPAGGTLLWRMSLAWGERDGATLRRLLWSGIACAAALTVVLLPIGVLVRQSVLRFLGVSSSDASLVGGIFLSLVAMVLITGLNETLGAVNSATQRARVTSIAQTAGQVTTHTVSITGLIAGLELLALLIGLVAGQLITTACLVIGVRNSFGCPIEHSTLRSPRPISTRSYFTLLAVGALSAALRGHTDRIVLAWLAAPVWVGYYSLAARLASLLMEFSNLIYVPTIAAAGALMGSNRWGAVRSLYARTMNVVSSGAAVLGFTLIGMADLLLVLWVGRPVPEAALILRILSAGTLVAVALTGPGTAVCKGIGHPGIETRYALLGLVLNIVLTATLPLAVGAIGTVLASSISWSVGAAYFAFLLHTRIRLPRLAMRRAATILVGVFTTAATIAILVNYLPPPAGRLQAFLMIAGISPLGIATLAMILMMTHAMPHSELPLVVNSLLKRPYPATPGP